MTEPDPKSARTGDPAVELPATPPKSIAREYFETIVVCILILVFARSFVFMQSKIPTESMLDTLLVGDYILVNRLAFGAPGDTQIPLLGQRDIRRHDVIVFRYPEDPDVDFVKRVVALPGERVEMVAGQVFVDGEALDEPFVRRDDIETRQFFGPVTVPAEQFFVLGDNRDNSRDSRVWGAVPRSMIKGRAFCIWFSYAEDRNDHLNTGVRRLRSIAKKARYLVTRTRWGRFPSLIE